ncbi:MAG TPA: radical SAM protein [Polyangiaceae bacterium]|jgi:MoaA/NifB/PqqE/SkfB family radical SAM enzyme
MDAPRTASIVTNMRCNQACTWCTRRAAYDDRVFVMAEGVRARIDAALAAGSRELTFTGGEPTMRRDLASLMAYARAAGAERITLETNATLLDDTSAGLLREAGLDVARLNTPAFGDACDALTRDPGGFASALRGMRSLARAGVAVEAAVTLLRSTVEHVSALPPRLHEVLGDALRTIVIAFPVEAADPTELLELDAAAAATLSLEGAARHVGVSLRMSSGDPISPCAFDRRMRSRVTRLYGMTKGAPARPGYAHLPACVSCNLRERCPGVAEAYVARFGAPSMYPVDDDRTRRRLTVISSVDDQIARELTARHVSAGTDGSLRYEETIRVIFRCNQACTFCFVSTHLPAPPPDLVEAAIRTAGARSQRIALSGGEPTLDPRLVDWVRLARSVSSGEIVLQTNALRLDDALLVSRLEEAGLDEAFVSLHGATAAVSDAVTEAPGTFSRTLAGIDNLHASKVRVMLNFVVCEKNRHELVDMVRLMASRWPRATLNISFVGPSTDLVPRDRDLIPRYTDALPAIAEAMALARRLGVGVFGLESMCGLPLCLVPGDLRDCALVELPSDLDAGEFLKTEECSRCAEQNKCWGLRRGYADIHGTSELHAL